MHVKGVALNNTSLLRGALPKHYKPKVWSSVHRRRHLHNCMNLCVFGMLNVFEFSSIFQKGSIGDRRLLFVYI